jgi:hypothetical protein
MKKTTLVILLSTILLLSFTASMVLSVRGNVTADKGVGPAPNSGDGIPDGSGFDQPNRQNEGSTGKGPAPNSGDGIPDGSGFPKLTN